MFGKGCKKERELKLRISYLSRIAKHACIPNIE